MIETHYSFNGDTGELCLYNRDWANEVGFRTTRLPVEETHKLCAYIAKLHRDAFAAGQKALASKLESILETVP